MKNKNKKNETILPVYIGIQWCKLTARGWCRWHRAERRTRLWPWATRRKSELTPGSGGSWRTTISSTASAPIAFECSVPQRRTSSPPTPLIPIRLWSLSVPPLRILIENRDPFNALLRWLRIQVPERESNKERKGRKLLVLVLLQIKTTALQLRQNLETHIEFCHFMYMGFGSNTIRMVQWSEPENSYRILNPTKLLITFGCHASTCLP